jgi:intracellular sulfur oxidation DsrE/DsrF family protein
MLKKLPLFVFGAALALAAIVTIQNQSVAQGTTAHRVVIQVTDDDEGTMNRALGNARNAQEYYSERGESLTVEIVTYGPGITMLRDDISPVKDAIQETREQVPGLVLSMCNNSKMGAERREGITITPVEGSQIVPAGIVRVMELQEEGYVYAKP